MRSSRIAAAPAVLAATALALTGCGLFGQDDPEDEGENQEYVESTNVSVYDIGVGDCLVSSDLADELRAVPVVPCEERHGAEVFDSLTLSGDEYPGDAEVSAEADGYCVEAFESFVGLSYDESELYAQTLQPSADTWEAGDREVLCIIYDPEGPVTGSLRDAGR